MRTLILLVDYHGTADTVECLESLLRMRGDFDVVIVDNSLAGELGDALSSWVTDPRRRVIPDNPIWKSLKDEPRLREPSLQRIAKERLHDADGISSPFVTLIAANENRGFAAGNNLGLRYGLGRDYGFFWLLNNDTVVLPRSLEEMLKVVTTTPDFGVCGATVVFYDRPDRVQCRGGAIFDVSRARSMYIGYNEPVFPLPDRESVERRLDMVVGASMLVSRRFVETIGLMNEGYFLYFEEMDWIVRNKKRFQIVYAPKAIVYHKHGASTKGNIFNQKMSSITKNYLHPNRLVFIDRYFPARKLRLRFWLLWDAIRALLKRDVSGAVSVARTGLGPVPRRRFSIPAITDVPDGAASSYDPL